MATAAAAIGLVVLFLLAETWGERLPARARRLPLVALSAVLFLAALELTRFDHGYRGTVVAIAFVGAPIAVIFCGAAAGARRWYGWPDLGPTPGRIAGVASALLLGVLAGSNVREADVEVSAERGTALRRLLVARKLTTGSWPARLSDVADPVPDTRMGMLSPPPFSWDPVAA